jgi:hypothetical protein
MLSDQLELVLFLFRGNAAALFPQKVRLRHGKREYFNLHSLAKHDRTGISAEAMPSQVFSIYTSQRQTY